MQITADGSKISKVGQDDLSGSSIHCSKFSIVFAYKNAVSFTKLVLIESEAV